MDRLAREGVHFSNAFVTTSLCSPSRASILTGLYAHAHGVVDNLKRSIAPDIVFFPRTCRQRGTRRPMSASGTWACTVMRNSRDSITG